MFRRFISFLVIAGLLASQLAVLPHAHAGMSAEERQQHDATPHFHCQGLSHDHGHDHSHGGHSHKHGDPSRESAPNQPANDSTGSFPPFGLVGLDHDATAVFVPVQASVPKTANDGGSAATAVLIPIVIYDFTDVRLGLRRAPLWHPPDAVLDGSDTYLTLRNLRI